MALATPSTEQLFQERIIGDYEMDTKANEIKNKIGHEREAFIGITSN